MIPVRAVVFDLDGTLIDSVPDIASALNRCLMDEGRVALAEPQVARLVGGGARELVARALGTEVPASDIDRVLAAFLDNYAARPVTRTVVYPGAHLVLAELAAASLPLAVCTNKPIGLTRTILATLDLAPHFAVVWGGEEGRPFKPDAACLRCVCADLRVAPAEAVMVGDSRADVEAARAAGCPAILVSHGYETRPLASLGAYAVVDGLPEAGELLARWAKEGISPLHRPV